jgi:sugar (pentulose or hexulose) kinase
MNESAGKLIAVFDVGKTNAKLSLVDPAQGRELWSVRRPNDVVETDAGRQLDVVGIEAWLLDSLRAAPHRHASPAASIG